MAVGQRMVALQVLAARVAGAAQAGAAATGRKDAMSERPKISFIIPVLHLMRPKNLSRFFLRRYTLHEVLRDLSENVSVAAETIVVCNGIDAELRSFVQSDRRVHRYCINSVNVGVARAWNMGAQLAEGEALCFVNDDVEIGKGAVEALYEVLMATPGAGQVGPRGARWRGGSHECWVGERVIEEADAVSGFMFLIRSDLFRQIGGFDVHYTPAGFEEIDMSFEIRRRGHKCLVVPNLQIRHHHHHGVSAYRTDISYLGKTIDTETLHDRNRRYFLEKWKNFDVT
jgi:GT2 family glycosyltransferase